MKVSKVLLFVIWFGGLSKSRGTFEVSITLHSYQNPGNRCLFCSPSNGQCDYNRSGCDNIFTYCLEELGRTACSNSQTLTSTVNRNGAAINFDSSSVLGIPNPFKLTQPDPLLKNIQLTIIVMDGLESTHELVDVFNITISGNAVFDPVTARYTGIYNISTIGLTYQVKCHGSSTNSCVDYCTEANCDPGQCTNLPSTWSYYCTCGEGTIARQCNYCQGVNCGMGHCERLQNSYRCNCPPTFTGLNCQVDLCDGHCKNNGTCTRNEEMPSCQCILPYEGDTCTQRDNCYNVSCNGGTCIDSGSTYRCSCPDGKIGDQCEIRDTCYQVQCNHGNCSRGTYSYTCICPAEFTGRNCQLTNYCDNIDCGSGTCVNEDAGFSCNCTIGFTGNSCETNIDDCENITCGGQGKCLDGNSSYYCLCENGFYGKHCEETVKAFVNETFQSTDASMTSSAIHFSVWIAVGLAVSIVVLISLLIICLLIMFNNRHKAKELSHHENHVIGDNPVYMAVNGPRNADQERFFVNTIYGAPDSTLYAIPETNSRVSGTSQLLHANHSSHQSTERRTRNEAISSLQSARPASSLHTDNDYVESSQYQQIAKNGSAQWIQPDTEQSISEESQAGIVPEDYEVPTPQAQSQESFPNTLSTSTDRNVLKKIPLLPPNGRLNKGIDSLTSVDS